jgi:hypothetical protein
MPSESDMISLVNIDLKLDVDGLLSKAWDKFLGLFGKDAGSIEFKNWLEEHTRETFLQARNVQCIGMHTPVLLSTLYQPTRLVRGQAETIVGFDGERGWDAPTPTVVSVDRFLLKKENAIITAGPGWGKTTLLRAVFIHFLTSSADEVLPVLFFLRQEDSIPQLRLFIGELDKLKKQNANKRILLLVDGYDEISTENRKLVSGLLFRYSTKAVGEYYLTCRDYYEIFDLMAPRLHVAEFTEEDQLRFVRAFLLAYGSRVDAGQLIKDIAERGFSDLLRHPLLLTLACIVKSSAQDFRARNIFSLIDAAIQTLSFRWDQSKGLKREASTPLDGAARVKCLKRVAFNIGIEPVRKQRIIEIINKQLQLMRWENADPSLVLDELAQFYGILVPIADKWGFVHRSLQDFLAAQYWVETGQFAQSVRAGSIKFDSRTAFAACQVDDATDVMISALQHEAGLPVFAEMLMNDASFDHSKIAQVIIKFYETYKGTHYYRRLPEKIECHLQDDFVSDASSKFLDYVVQVCARSRGQTADTLAAYAIVELFRRGFPLSRLAYDACKKNYIGERFTFDVLNKSSHIKFVDVRHR